jgi:hypothetical protein
VLAYLPASAAPRHARPSYTLRRAHFCDMGRLTCKHALQQIGLTLPTYMPAAVALRRGTWDAAVDWSKMDSLAKYWHEQVFAPLQRTATLKRTLTREHAFGAHLCCCCPCHRCGKLRAQLCQNLA